MDRGRTIAFSIVAGACLGLFSRYSSSLAQEIRWVGNFGASWFLVAFGLGLWVRRAKLAALGGVVALVTAVAFHYVPTRLAKAEFGIDLVAWWVVAWALIGAAGGALFGWLGARRSWPATAAMSGLLLGEAVLLFMTAPSYARYLAIPLEVVVGVGLPFFLHRDALIKTYVATVAVVPVAFVAVWLSTLAIGRVYPGL